MPDWLIFAFAALLIVVGGATVAVCADVISHQTRIGVLWFGTVVVALVTSLPELVTDVSAVRDHAPALAMGDLFGSSMANMAILATVTLIFRARRLLQRVALEHVLTATLAIVLSALAVLFISSQSAWTVGRFGIGPLVLFIVYVGGNLAIRDRQSNAVVEHEEERVGTLLPLRTARIGFVLGAVAILVAGPFLASSADTLATQSGLGEGFFGSFVLAIITSLPELAVSITAIRVGALNLAIANLLGSNATNMALLLPLEIAYAPGSILGTAGPEIQTAAAASVLLMAIGISAIVLRSERSRTGFDMAAVLMLVSYFFGLWAVYQARA